LLLVPTVVRHMPVAGSNGTKYLTEQGRLVVGTET
jgi:hypothetical protein